MSRRTAALTTLALALLPAAALAQTVTTVVNNGTTESRYDIVILGDGYQANEQNKFDQDVQTFLTGMFQKAPYNIFAAYYNVHTVFRASQDSGADRPDESPPVFVNTAYEATYNYAGTARCLYIQNTSQALADAALAPATEGRILVMVNDTRYGGCASTFAVSYTGSQMVEVQSHEIGHSLGLLADEYEYAGQTYGGPEPASPNLTLSPTGQKWSHWHGTQGISAFEGGGYNEFGIYRPRVDCLMRSLGQVLCRVCQENIVRVTNSICNVITSTTPPTSQPVAIAFPAQQTFSLQHFVPPGNNPTVEWRLNGVPQAGATSASFTLDSTQMALGSYTLEARLQDQSDRVRHDPSQTMVETRTWQVQISDPTAAQLRIASATASAVLVTPGATVDYTLGIANDGPAAAGAFAVELFLTQQPNWSTQDTLLARAVVPGVTAGQVANLTIATQLPWSTPLQLSNVYIVVDREDVVNENNENDNVVSRALFTQAGGCHTGLEFQDPMVTPFAGAVSVAAGGTVHPTIVAPCADPTATIYLLAWGGSGTSPGLPLGGLTLPLNFDGFTQTGLDALNGPVFGQFLGVLDPQGVARAQFTLPPATGLPSGTTHFAAVLLGSTQLFQAVTNPVELVLDP